MAFQWTRRVLLALAPAALLALAACDSSTIESQFRPTRVVAFGDALSDMGQVNGRRYMVDNSENVWVRLVGKSYDLDNVKAAAAGGTVYATGNARIVAKPDAAGNAATPTIKEQVDAFLAGGTFGPDDLVILQGGISDLIVQAQAHRANQITREQLLANMRQAGLDYAAQARRLSAAGARHIAVMGLYDLSVTPWSLQTSIASLISEATRTFNDTVLVELVNEGQTMLFVDTALLFNLMVSSPAAYGFNTVVAPVCSSAAADPGPGIGIGTNQISSYRCTVGTLEPGADPTKFLWADPVYPTTAAHTRLADFTYNRLISRW